MPNDTVPNTTLPGGAVDIQNVLSEATAQLGSTPVAPSASITNASVAVTPQPVTETEALTPVDLTADSPSNLDITETVVDITPSTPPPSGVGAAPSAATAQNQTSVRGMTSLADALYAKGIIDDQALKSVKFESVTNGTPHEQIIIKKGLATEEQVQSVRAEMFGIGFVDLSSVSIKIELLNKVPQESAQQNMAIAYDESSNRVKVAMIDPLDLQKVKFIESMIGKPVDAYYATRSAIQRVIDTKYGAQIGQEVDEALEDVGVLDLSRSFDVQDIAGQGFDNAPVAKIVNMILDYAVKHHASDVHIEPREGKISVRYRIHGILSEKLTLPNKLGPSVVSRIKILADMKIDEHRIPQDNRFQVRTGDRVVDLRVSVMPAIYGEKVVMRLLEKGADVLSLEETGLRGPAYKSYKEGLAKTQGILLITGPTGSGKTQTLASSLSILNTQEVNILTVEDPVEIRVDGVTQVQVNPEVGLTFSSALRAFLRQDPDIIMVGEIRDAETADLAVQAALTGHLVLATLHTNSAPGALPRLLDMGVQPFLLSSTINVIMAQRLVRKLCDECKREVDATAEEMQLLHQALDPLQGLDLKSSSGKMLHFDSATSKVKLYQPVGCPKCADSGYQGRVGIFEAMTVTEKIGKMIVGHQSANEIAAQAQQDGMITMVQDGYIKALDGVTTISEVLRVQNV